MQITYHGTPKRYWDAQDASQPYTPPDFAREGYIHCTDGLEAVLVVLALYYKDQPGEWLLLDIDRDRVTSPIRYEDPAQIFPHIYGPLNRDAIVAARVLPRATDGTFLRPRG